MGKSAWLENRQSGQTVLIVVLVMIVALTIGLSIASRTVINLKISKQNEESQRALQAAESGVEASIKNITAGQSSNSYSLNNNSNVNVQVTPQNGQRIILNGQQTVGQDTGIDVWLSDYPDFKNPISPNLNIYWNDPNQTCVNSQNQPAALEVLILSGTDPKNPKLTKRLFDPCKRIAGAEISTPVVGDVGFGQDNKFRDSVQIAISNGLIMKLIPIYNSTKFGVYSSNIALPSQGIVVVSTGTSGDTKRKIVYFQSYPQIPAELFQYGILSQ